MLQTLLQTIQAYFTEAHLRQRFTPEVIELVVILFASIAITAVFFLVYNALARTRRRREARLARVSDHAGRRSGRDQARSSLRSADYRPTTGLIRYLPKRELLRIRLQRAGFSGALGLYVAVSITITMVVALGMLIFGDLPPLAAPISAIASGILIPHSFLSWRAGKREQAFLKNLPEGIDIIVRGLKAGLPVSESMSAVGREAPEPVGGMFRKIGDVVQIGHPLEVAIEKVSKQMAVPELRFLAITMSVQKETGGNLTETLQNLAEILRRRRQMKLKVKAMSSEARASAFVLGSLPFIMFLLIYFVSRDYVMTLFTDPRGPTLVYIGLGMIGTGAAVMAKMIKFDI